MKGQKSKGGMNLENSLDMGKNKQEVLENCSHADLQTDDFNIIF